MNKEDIILTSLRVLLVDAKGEFEESRKACIHLIDEAFNPKESKELPCEMEECVKSEVPVQEDKS